MLQRTILALGRCEDFGGPNKESDYLGVVAWKPYCYLEKLIKEKKEKCVVGLAVKGRKKQNHW